MDIAGYIIVWKNLKTDTGVRLCQDFKFRSFAFIGSYSECLKIYRRKGNAVNFINRFAKSTRQQLYILPIYKGETIDACGRLANDDKRISQEEIDARLEQVNLE